MTLEQRLVLLAQAIGADVKTLTANQGSLSGLNTTAKNSLVAAINEIAASLGAAGAQINDAGITGNTTETYSVNRILALIDAAKTAVKSELTNGAAAALDTLSELASALNNDPSFASNIATQIAVRVRFDSAQTLNATQQAQACANIGVGDPDKDFVATYTTAKA